jgi:hypothetical protein
VEAGAAGRALIALAVVGAFGVAVFAGQRTVEVSAEVRGDGRTPEQARREALQRARDRAVAEVTGIHVSAQQLRLRTVDGTAVDDAFSYLVHTSTHGRIVDEQVAFETRLEDGVPVYRATLRATVELEEGRPDPGFVVEIDAEPDTHTLRAGEPVTVWVAASRESYLTLLNLRDDGTVALIFPNEYADDNRLAPGEPAALPAPRHAFRFEARLEEGDQGGAEQLLAVATLDPVPFRLPDGDTVELAGDGDPTLAALNRWLLQIPVERRAEAIRQFKVIE